MFVLRLYCADVIEILVCMAKSAHMKANFIEIIYTHRFRDTLKENCNPLSADLFNCSVNVVRRILVNYGRII